MTASSPSLTITERGGFFHLAGVINEFADFSPLVGKPIPLHLNMREVSRFNSIGVRNLLKFLVDHGTGGFEYYECPVEFIEQINIIPSLLGPRKVGRVVSFFIPYSCDGCDHEETILGQAKDYESVAVAGPLPTHSCPKCGGTMHIYNDSFFSFLSK